MRRDVVIAIDTSNYTTSVAFCDEDGKVIANVKLPLPVAQGERGLRQSDAVFAHVKNMPSLMEEVADAMRGGTLTAIGVSEAPRRAEGSYMPCFLSGVASAVPAAAATGVPDGHRRPHCIRSSGRHRQEGSVIISFEQSAASIRRRLLLAAVRFLGTK